MKTSEGVIILCVLAAVTLSCESVKQQLNSIDDLKRIDFGQSVPRHSLLLLHWFANNIEIDQHSRITMTYDPNIDFGSHHYGNFEDLLDRAPRGYSYYTVGNLNEDFPVYVHNPPVWEYQGENLDRIIVSAAEIQNSGVYRINQVFLTQHIPGTAQYDPDHTYQISTNLLQQIRQFSSGTSASLRGLRQQFRSDMSDYQLNAFRQTWGAHLVCLGLLLFIVIQERYSRPYSTQFAISPQSVTQPVYSPNSSYSATQPVHLQSSSYNRGNNESVNECLFSLFIIAVIVILFFFLFSSVPKR